MLHKDYGSYWLECDNCDDSTYGTGDYEYFNSNELENDAANNGWFVNYTYDDGPYNQYRADFCCKRCKKQWEAGYYGSK